MFQRAFKSGFVDATIHFTSQVEVGARVDGREQDSSDFGNFRFFSVSIAGNSADDVDDADDDAGDFVITPSQFYNNNIKYSNNNNSNDYFNSNRSASHTAHSKNAAHL